jgi:hypothetical protein
VVHIPDACHHALAMLDPPLVILTVGVTICPGKVRVLGKNIEQQGSA